MDFLELISFSKVFSAALHLDSDNILSKADLEITSMILKKMADKALNWNQYQQEIYKAMVDFIKYKMDEM